MSILPDTPEKVSPAYPAVGVEEEEIYSWYREAGHPSKRCYCCRHVIRATTFTLVRRATERWEKLFAFRYSRNE